LLKKKSLVARGPRVLISVGYVSGLAAEEEIGSENLTLRLTLTSSRRGTDEFCGSSGENNLFPTVLVDVDFVFD
jgi:hypothetical protein